MPKHDDDWDERSAKKHKKHKRSRHSDGERDSSTKKPKRYASEEGSSSSEAPSSSHKSSHSSKHGARKERLQTSHREIKREKHRHYPEEAREMDRQATRTRIKREEDFDNRQEELRRRRMERSHRQERFENHRIKQEHQEDRDHGRERRRNDEQRRQERRRRDEAGQVEEAFKNTAEEKDNEPPEKERPNLGLSGALTEDTNTYRGVVIKYNEPPEARIPKKKWRLYPFKGTEALKTLHLHRQSAYLLGRLRRIADIPIDHPSCSKQHAVLQFRMVEIEVNGQLRRRVKPYVIDLGAANGTYVNNERIEAQRYVELKEQDVLKFGFSSREYVLLHDKSDTTEMDSDSEEEDDED